MYIKVYCPCGAKFAFDVELSGGRMPVTIACPTCGQDATELANEQIRQQLAPAPTPAVPDQPQAAKKPSSRLHINLPQPNLPAQDPPPTRLAIRRESAPQTDGGHPDAPTCPKHPGQSIIESCRVCGRPICEKCMALFGYVCSVFCRNKADAQGLELPVYARQRSVLQRHSRNRNRAIMAVCASVFILLVAAGIYYKFYASKPRVFQTLSLASGEFETGFCKLLQDDTCLSLAGGNLSLHNLGADDAVWSVPLNEDEEAAGSDAVFWAGVGLLDHRDDLWVKSGNRVMCYERDNGNCKHRLLIEGHIEDYLVDDNSITFVNVTGASLGNAERTITRIALGNGHTTTHQIPVPPTEEVGRKENRSAGNEVSSTYIVTGPNVAELQVKLLESRTITRKAFKAPEKSIMDSGAVSGANAMEAAEELLNEIARGQTGGVEYEDASRYEVTLLRHMETNAQKWTGEAIGQVALYPARTMDLLVDTKSLRVFDKRNHLKWEAPLSFPVDDIFLNSFGRRETPALESEDTLYFFDKGMLTAFDSATGVPRWRVTSVGIRKVQEDIHGNLYVCTSTAGAEDIKYSSQIKIIDALQPMLMKVDSANGEVLWQTTQAGDNCFLTGDYVYATKSTIDLSIALNPDNDSIHFRVIRIDPKTGDRIWTYYRPQKALTVDFRNNVFLLQFPDKIQLLKYMTL